MENSIDRTKQFTWIAIILFVLAEIVAVLRIITLNLAI